MNKVQILESCIKLFDQSLSDVYNEPVTRQDYMLFLKWFNTRMFNFKLDKIPFNITKERKKWGLISVNGNRQWKLSIILNELESHNIIERSGYSAGNIENYEPKTREYAYTTQFYKELDLSFIDFIEEEISVKTNNKIVYFKDKDAAKKQYDLLMSDRFSIDYDAAINILTNQELDPKTFLSRIHKLQCLYNKEIWTSVAATGREYTSFLNLNKELRSQCTIDGEKLFVIDLKTSQTYLFASKMLKELLCEDTYNFYKDVVEKDIYEIILKHIPIEYEYTRNDVKEEFYRFLYKRTMRSPRQVDIIIKKLYPRIYDIIKELKTSLRKNEKQLSDELQELEASIFIPIGHKYIERGCLTMHDGVACKPEIVNELREDLKERMAELGLKNYVLVVEML